MSTLLQHCVLGFHCFLAAENPAEKSDIWRYAILNQIGGLYVDTDFECIQNVCFLFPTNYCTVLIRKTQSSSLYVVHNSCGLEPSRIVDAIVLPWFRTFLQNDAFVCKPAGLFDVTYMYIASFFTHSALHAQTVYRGRFSQINAQYKLLCVSHIRDCESTYLRTHMILTMHTNCDKVVAGCCPIDHRFEDVSHIKCMRKERYHEIVTAK